MRKIWILFILSCLLLFATACHNSQEPEITIEAFVTQLSEEEFEYEETGLDNPSIDDFRKFTFNFDVKHSPNIERKVVFPEQKIWREAINTIDNKDRYWFGEGYEQNNDDENFARYNNEIVIYSKGLNDKEIKEAFNSVIFELSLETKKEIIEKNYKVSDLIELNQFEKPISF